MTAAESVHLRVRLEPGQTDRALLVGRAAEERPEPARRDPAAELLREGRELECLWWSLVQIGRLWEVDPDNMQDRPYDLFKDGDW